MAKVGVNQLGYVGVNVSNINAWQQFAVNTMGLQENGKDKDGTTFLKMDEYHHRIALHPGGKDDIAYAGWQVANEKELQTMASQLKGEGIEIIWGSKEETKKRKVMGFFKFEDIDGLATEIFYGPEVSYNNDFRSPTGLSGFETGVLGAGHIVLMVKDIERSVRFYQDMLGFRVSDMIEKLDEFGLSVTFMHCNPRHHSLALVQMKPMPGVPSGQRLNHIMLQTKTLDDVGSTYYRCQEKGVAMRMSLGRHGNDQMVSFYVVTPSGFAIECGWGARTVDDATWQVTITPDDPWGHIFNGRPMPRFYSGAQS